GPLAVGSASTRVGGFDPRCWPFVRVAGGLRPGRSATRLRPYVARVLDRCGHSFDRPPQDARATAGASAPNRASSARAATSASPLTPFSTTAPETALWRARRADLGRRRTGTVWARR